MADLTTTICGLTFRNPVLPGAGPNVADGTLLRAAAEGGGGGLVTHTVSTMPAPELTPYREVRGGLLNNQLWSAHPVERWLERDYAEAREAAAAAGIPLIVNIGYSAAEVASLAPRVGPFADAVEISTHYVRESGGLMADPAAAAREASHLSSMALSRHPEPLLDAIRAAKAALDLPVLVKLGLLGGGAMAEVARACEAAGADAIVAIDAFGPCMGIDIETAEPVLAGGDGHGWLSGASLKPLALRCVFDIARAVKIPVIGCGGIAKGEDAIEMLMAGASAVQVCSAALTRGPRVYGAIAAEVGAWLDKRGYASVGDVVGLGIRRWQSLQPHTYSVPILYDEGECIGCKLCERSCHYDAIYMVGKLAEFNPERCFGCGLCVARCPTNALLMPQATRERGIVHPLSGEPVGMLRGGAGHVVETSGRQ
ncbi:MAG: 4Fe-4S binding protein [Kouleothrix sp.]|nr:4Fe-4S binding protein [Kouleothrix sp.]